MIAATHHNLEQAVAEGRFRADLYYRLSVYPIHLPSLRERVDDIPRLVWFFIHRHQRDLGRQITKVPQSLMESLQRYAWPGNVRELENIVERAMIASDGDTLQLDAPLALGPRGRAHVEASDNLDAIQRAHIESVLVGSSFVFGPLGNPDVWPRIVTGVLGPDGSQYANIFAFMVLPTIIFIAALFAMLYYFGVMQFVVRLFAVIMRRFMRASGAESLNVAASIFMGQTEAPLTIRPFLPRMTESELMTVMTAGMAHISGGVMAAYILFGVEAQHLLTAVIMTAPGTLMMAKIFVPETRSTRDDGHGAAEGREDGRQCHRRDRARHGRGTSPGAQRRRHAHLVPRARRAAERGAGSGGRRLQRVAGFGAGLSLQLILGYVFAPIAWALGVPWQDATTVGNLLGTRMVLNEFVAYSQLGPLKATLDPKSFTIATFALCGFANFSSIGIQIGGIGALAPERRHDLARLGLRAMLAGTFANFLTATIAGMLL